MRLALLLCEQERLSTDFFRRGQGDERPAEVSDLLRLHLEGANTFAALLVLDGQGELGLTRLKAHRILVERLVDGDLGVLG